MPVEPSVINIAIQASQSGGMLFACWAIVIVLALMFVVFMRAHKKDYALAIIPLVILPLAHIFSRLLANALDNILPLTGVELQVAIDMTAGLVSCLLIGLTGRRIQEKRTRLMFSLCCSGFIIILALVFVVNILMNSRV